MKKLIILLVVAALLSACAINPCRTAKSWHESEELECKIVTVDGASMAEAYGEE